jgi:hypothetical protein
VRAERYVSPSRSAASRADGELFQIAANAAASRRGWRGRFGFCSGFGLGFRPRRNFFRSNPQVRKECAREVATLVVVPRRSAASRTEAERFQVVANLVAPRGGWRRGLSSHLGFRFGSGFGSGFGLGFGPVRNFFRSTPALRM